jgi:hypothetical protein
MLHGDGQQLPDQVLHRQLSGQALRDLHDPGDIGSRGIGRLFDRHRRLAWWLPAPRRCVTFQKVDLDPCPPVRIGRFRPGQVSGGRAREATLTAQPGRQFVGDRLLLHEAFFAGMPDRGLVQAQRLDSPAAQPRRFSLQQQQLVGEG